MLLKTRNLMDDFLKLLPGQDEFLTTPTLSDFKIIAVWLFHSGY